MSFLLPITFALSFGIICGIYWALVLRPEGATRGELAERLRATRGPKSATARLIKDVERLSNVPALEKLLGRFGAASGRIQQLIDSADVDLTVGKFVVGTALLAAGTYFAVVLFL